VAHGKGGEKVSVHSASSISGVGGSYEKQKKSKKKKSLLFASEFKIGLFVTKNEGSTPSERPTWACSYQRGQVNFFIFSFSFFPSVLLGLPGFARAMANKTANTVVIINPIVKDF
jgi:hypothetical protein